MKRVPSILLLICLIATLGFADEASFHHVKVPNQKGRHIKAVLTFSDSDKAVEMHPVKGKSVTIPYAQIDRCSYEYTEEVSLTFTEGKAHWLEIDYRDQDTPRVFVVLMDKHNYLRILDALKAHTGIDAEVLGNAKKR